MSGQMHPDDGEPPRLMGSELNYLSSARPIQSGSIRPRAASTTLTKISTKTMPAGPRTTSPGTAILNSRNCLISNLLSLNRATGSSWCGKSIKKLQEDQARPIIYHLRSATCWHPHVKGLTIMVNSLFNGWRFEDLWLNPVKLAPPLKRRRTREGHCQLKQGWYASSVGGAVARCGEVLVDRSQPRGAGKFASTPLS